MSLGTFVLVLISAVLHASWNFAARKASGDVGLIWLSLWVGSLMCLPFALSLGLTADSVWAAGPYMLATGVIHSFYFGLLAKSYQHGEISYVYPIARGTGVAGTAIAASVLIQENLSWSGIAGVVAISLGVCSLGWNESRSRKNLRSGALALLVGTTIISYSVVDKVGVGKIHPVFYVFSQYFLASLFLSPYAIVRPGRALRDTWKSMKRYIFLIAPASMATYLIILFAFQGGKVSYIVAVREFAVVIGSAFGVVFLKERLSLKKCIGIAGITCGMIVVAFAY